MDFNRSRQVWHGQIAKWGGGVNKGYLVRAGVKRVATMAMLEYTPKERSSGLYADGAVRFWVSALNIWNQEDKWPDFETDQVEFKGRLYRILLPPSGQQPDGTWIAFDLSCMFVEKVT
jgi:hypothetical protein